MFSYDKTRRTTNERTTTYQKLEFSDLQAELKSKRLISVKNNSIFRNISLSLTVKNCGKLLITIENCGILWKTWKTIENCGNLWKTVENCGKLGNLLKTVENCEKLRKTVETSGKL